MNQPLHRRPVEAPEPRRGPEARPPRHLEVVAERRSRLASQTTRTRLLLGGAAGVAVAVAFALVYLHVVMAQRQFQIDRVSGRAAQQQATYTRLRLQMADLEAPQRIIATAEGKLGMIQPSGVTYLTPTSPLPPGGSVAGGSTNRSPAGITGGGKATVPAPAGDADWPQIKSQLAGSP